MKHLTLIFALLTSSKLLAQWNVVYSDPTKTFTGIQFTSSTTGYVVADNTANAFLLKTTDGGITWTESLLPAAFNFIQNMYFLNDSVGYLIAAGEPTKIIKTVNGGSTWMGHTLDSAFFVAGFSFFNEHSGFYMNNEGRFRSVVADGSDYGYLTDTLGGASTIVFSDSLHGFIAMENGILTTADQGVNWNFLPSGVPGFMYGPAFAFSDNQHGYMATRSAMPDAGTIFSTSNGGVSWTSEINFAASYLSSYDDYVLAVNDTGYIAYTSNAGVYWVTEALPSTELWMAPYRCEVTPGKDFFIVKEFEGKIYKRTGALSQTEMESNNSFDVYPNPVNDLLNIRSTTEYEKVEIIDVNGRVIISTTQTRQIDVSNLTNGIYTMKLTSANGTSFYSKFIKS